MATRELTLVKTTLILFISTICIVFVPTVHISIFVSTSIELVCTVVQRHFNVLWQRYVHSLLRSVWQKVQAAKLLLCSGTASGVLISLSKATESKVSYAPPQPKRRGHGLHQGNWQLCPSSFTKRTVATALFPFWKKISISILIPFSPNNFISISNFHFTENSYLILIPFFDCNSYFNS